MSTDVQVARTEIIYPESDGQPMADNTLQFRWIVTLQGNLDAQFLTDPNVFVAGDLLWYPVEGNNTIRIAPDALVVFGRPKGDRGSYLQWLENDIAPHVVFEILSPGNRYGQMIRKFQFYERYGVEEYYLYDPDHIELSGWIRSGSVLKEISDVNGWVSPRLGIRFRIDENDLQIFAPDGRPFLTYLELFEKSELNQKRAETERQRADRLETQLKSLGVKPEFLESGDLSGTR